MAATVVIYNQAGSPVAEALFNRGVPPNPIPRVDEWQVPGIDGYGEQLMGQGNAEFEMGLESCLSSNADANAWIDALTNLVGTTISFSDNWGDTYYNYFLKDVDRTAADTKKAVIAAGAYAVYTKVKLKMVCVG